VSLTPTPQAQLIVTTPLHDTNLVDTSTVSADEVSYSSLIDMQEVKDDSSDFELPDHITDDNI
jgi:hypothetical protein